MNPCRNGCRWILSHPCWAGAALALITLFTGALTIVLADFGAPLWVFLLLAAWLLTAGLPATLGVLLLVSLWGQVPGLHGIGLFIACSALLAIVFQASALAWLNRRITRSAPAP